MFAVVDDNALEEEQKALHRKKIVDWVDSAAKLPSGCDKHTEGPHSPTPLALDVGTKIIHADPSSSDYTSPNIYTGTVTTAYLDPNDNCLVLYSLVINGTNSTVDDVNREMIQSIKNPGGSKASKTPTKRKPDNLSPSNERTVKASWDEGV